MDSGNTIRVSIPHQLGRAGARERIAVGFTRMMRQLPGTVGHCTEQWDGDRLSFSVVALGQAVRGVVDVGDAIVTMEIELPGLLGRIAASFKGRIERAGRLLLTKKKDH